MSSANSSCFDFIMWIGITLTIVLSFSVPSTYSQLSSVPLAPIDVLPPKLPLALSPLCDYCCAIGHLECIRRFCLGGCFGSFSVRKQVQTVPDPFICALCCTIDDDECVDTFCPECWPSFDHNVLLRK